MKRRTERDMSSSRARKNVRTLPPSESKGKLTSSHASHTSSDVENNKFDPTLLPTVGGKNKKGPKTISRSTKVARNQAEQEMLAKKHTNQTVSYLSRRTKFNSEEVTSLPCNFSLLFNFKFFRFELCLIYSEQSGGRRRWTA